MDNWKKVNREPPPEGSDGLYKVVLGNSLQRLAMYRPGMDSGKRWIDFFTRKYLKPKMWDYCVLDVDGLIRSLLGKRKAVMGNIPHTVRGKEEIREVRGHTSGLMESVDVIRNWLEGNS